MATTNCDTNEKSISINKHRCYEDMAPRWAVIQDTIQDEYQIKSKGTEYLPMPSGMTVKPEKIRNEMYSAYKTRAVYYAYLSQTIGGMMGLVTRKPAQIELPKSLIPIINSTGFDGDALSVIMNRTLENQLSYSRYGILLDIRDEATGTDVLPFMSEYLGDKIINWQHDVIKGKETLVSLILDESYYDTSAGFNETYVEMYRICALDYKDKDTPVYYTYQATPSAVGQFVNGQPMPTEGATTPNILNKTLDFIPFQPFNALSLEMKTEIPILMQLANMSIAIYRGEADYRQSLFMQGQATPYAIGVNGKDDTIELGAGTMMEITNEKAQVGFAEVSGNGLDAQKQGLDGLHNRCNEIGISLASGNSQESGEALNIRVGVKTASLVGVAKINAKGFENLLEWCAVWKGLNPDDVSVTPNTDYSDGKPDMKAVLDFANMVKTGQQRAEDFYNYLVKFELTTALDYETWIDDIQSSPMTMQEFVISEAETVQE